MERKKLPVGIENFEEIRKEGFYYVDKTGLIRDLLNSWGKVNLFTRPRRFGKTLNMSMLKSFFEIGANRTLFDGLAISKETTLCEAYGGFQAADFPGCVAEAPEQIALMLGDLLQGGYMGVKETDARYASGMEYNRLVLLKSKSTTGYRLYMLRFKMRSAAIHMFPNRKLLVEMYPRAGRHAAVLPFLFFYQMFAYPIKKVRSGALRRDIRSGSSTLEQETQARLDMFRKLDML